MRRATLLAALLALAAPAWGADAVSPDSPAAAANAFYAVYGSQHAQGIPDATARLRYSAVLTPRLNKQIADAAAAQARMSARVKVTVKNAVPPMLEGDIFSSLFEGATSWKVGACTVSGATARCPVALRRDPVAAARPEKPASWNDVLVLATTPAGWKVDDVIYDPGFAFGNTGRLSDMLGMVAATSP